MITLLHGDDTTASRNELNHLKNGREVRQLNGKTLTDTMLVQALESNSLFGGNTLVVIENLLSGKKLKFAEIIKKAPTDVILWESKEVGVANVKSLGSANIQLFKIPIALFQFLDSLHPGSVKTTLVLFQKSLTTHSPELIFTMIVRRLRQLIQVADGVTPEGLQSWQVSRLTSQARSFTIDGLTRLYRKLLDMEYSIKTGASPFTLKQLLEQYIIDL